MDVIVSSSPWHPTNLMSMLNTGDRLIAPAFQAQDGKRAVVLVDAALDTVGKNGIVFHETVCLKANKTMPGVVQIRSNNVRVNCEVDCNGLAAQGVQALVWNGVPAAPPSGINLDHLYVHHVAPNPGDTNGLNHAIYFSEARGATGVDMCLAHIPNGSGIQLRINVQGCVFDRIDMLDVYQGAMFWDTPTTGNKVTHVYIPVRTPNRGQSYPGEYPYVQGGGAAGNVFDYTATPKDGYGAAETASLEMRVTALEQAYARLRAWIAAGNRV